MTGLAAGAMAAMMIFRAARVQPENTGALEKAESAPSGRVKLDVAAQRNIGLAFEKVQLRHVVGAVQANGVVGPNETRVAHVRPIARGRIEKVYVRLGDRVRAGQTLLVYDNVELGEVTGQYVSALAALEKAEAEAQVARRSVERAKSLVDIGALAKAELDRRATEYKSALASIESQKAEAAKVEEKLHRFGLSEDEIQKLSARGEYHREASNSRLSAPFSGIIVKSVASEGESVGPEDELFMIADLSTVWVQADVYEKDIRSIRQGQEARIVTDSYPGQVFLGRITYVSDFLDPKTRTAKVRCEVLNTGGQLKLEMFATVQLPTPQGRDALMVPSAAIQRVNDRGLVFVKTGDTEFQVRYVELAGEGEGWVEVTSGLRQDETVATHGSFFLKSTLLRSEIGGDD
ncbi:MAG: efflux RND transporter periplasmic adaptor subunit [Acidobacteria bacterium]|nr:efflux RND transporter periplasmic adaptor subunit [Acidobacteriota bacterium]